LNPPTNAEAADRVTTQLLAAPGDPTPARHAQPR